MNNKQQEVRDFLEKATKDKGFSLNSLSLKLGKNPTYLFHFIKRRSPRRLDEPTRKKLSQILDVPEQKLCDYPIMGGIIQDKLSTISGLLGIGQSKSELKGVEVLSLDDLLIPGKNRTLGYECLSPEMAKYYGFNDIEDIKIIKNTGDAMIPTIGADDIILVDGSRNKADSDGIYLIKADGAILLRRIQLNPFNGSLELSADNSIYKSYTINNSDELDIYGKVLAVTHRL